MPIRRVTEAGSDSRHCYLPAKLRECLHRRIATAPKHIVQADILGAERGTSGGYRGKYGRPESRRLRRSRHPERSTGHVRVDLQQEVVAFGQAAAGHDPIDPDSALLEGIDDHARANGNSLDQSRAGLECGGLTTAAPQSVRDAASAQCQTGRRSKTRCGQDVSS